MKYAVVERARLTIRYSLYKYYSYKITYRYVDVLPKFGMAYNDMVQSTTGMASSRVTDACVHFLWRRMEVMNRPVGDATTKFCVGQHVRISKEKMKFAKAAELNFSSEIFRFVNLIDRRPQAIYVLEDLKGTPIDVQFYQEEMTPVRITSQTTYKINNILEKRIRRGIREYLFHWRGYSRDIPSWVLVSSVTNI